MEWTTASIAYRCGLCGVRIAAGARFAVLTTHRKTRCESCAPKPSALDDDLPLAPTPGTFEDLAAVIDDQQSTARALLRRLTAGVEDDDLPLAPEVDADAR